MLISEIKKKAPISKIKPKNILIRQVTIELAKFNAEGLSQDIIDHLNNEPAFQYCFSLRATWNEFSSLDDVEVLTIDNMLKHLE
ncbi:hypothetical protein H0A36_23815 [Endozoicomonas sp. SM1973]|uniref:Uncharacterized protein n=1 Tax=Spartinivicinus marinus TaxID=2994442 RepID=A0A853IB48_9GAMM|nr:hypothetical protein [Spartinivicinus marinus]MCX4027807.1 hypothetical protein [Spartinivicinus marinus]NYZ69052.1 hypothetical protein [Spartinivicinus marinus]